MASLEDNQARMVAALQALEAKVAGLKDTHALHAANAELQGKLAHLDSHIGALKSAGEEAVRDLDTALGQLADLAGVARG